MSNFQCPYCGMTNIDCDKEGFKTPREIELEERIKELEEKLNAQFAEMEEKLTAEEMKNYELKEELATYKKMLDNPEFRIALTDVRTGEREVWRKLGRKATRYHKALEEVEEKITALHCITIPFHRGITHELADIVQEYKNQILAIIHKAKGEKKCQ